MIFRNSTILVVRIFAILGIVFFAYNVLANGFSLGSIFILFVACCFYYTFAESAKSRALRYLKDAKQGSLSAQYYFGVCNMTGNGVIKNTEEGIKWFQKAAEQGNKEAIKALKELNLYAQSSNAHEPTDAQAQYELGLRYVKGDGFEKDCLKGVDLYLKAAKQGHAKAQNNLGFCYLIGSGVKKNEFEAIKWFREAAEQGDADGQYNLGICYEKGFGIEKDHAASMILLNKADFQEHPKAKGK